MHASETQKHHNIKWTKTTKKAQVWAPLMTAGLETERVYSRKKISKEKMWRKKMSAEAYDANKQTI